MKAPAAQGLFLSLVLGLAACGGGPRSPFVRITAQDGRVYYAEWQKTLHSDTGGFLAFRDLVTRESVRLKNGTYEAQACAPDEVRIRQLEQLDDPTIVPGIDDRR